MRRSEQRSSDMANMSMRDIDRSGRGHDRRHGLPETVAAHGDRSALRWTQAPDDQLGRVDLRASTPTASPVPRLACAASGVRPGRPRRADDAQHPRVPRARPGGRASAAPRRSRSTTRRRPSRSRTWPATARRSSASSRTPGSSSASSRCATSSRRSSDWRSSTIPTASPGLTSVTYRQLVHDTAPSTSTRPRRCVSPDTLATSSTRRARPARRRA